jgi:hypothetical protein
LDCGCPAIFRRRRSFFLGFARARRRREGCYLPPLRIFRSCWAGEGLWACQKGQIGQKNVRFGQLGAARSRQDELIERRPGEQGTQDAHKSKCGDAAIRCYGNLTRLPYEGMRLNPPSWGFWAGRSPARAPRSGAGARAQGGGAPPPQRILRSCWAGEGLWACQKGQIGQKMVRFGLLGAARSRQDELIERRPGEQGTQAAQKIN